MLAKMKTEPVSDGDRVAEGVTVLATPGHTKGHMAVLLEIGDKRLLVAGDALPDDGTVRRGLPYNIFWDVEDASESVSKMLAASSVFYPGHDRPFGVDGGDITYLEGPTQVEIVGSLEGGGETSVTYRLQAQRPPNISRVQKD